MRVRAARKPMRTGLTKAGANRPSLESRMGHTNPRLPKRPCSTENFAFSESLIDGPAFRLMIKQELSPG